MSLSSRSQNCKYGQSYLRMNCMYLWVHWHREMPRKKLINMSNNTMELLRHEGLLMHTLFCILRITYYDSFHVRSISYLYNMRVHHIANWGWIFRESQNSRSKRTILLYLFSAFKDGENKAQKGKIPFIKFCKDLTTKVSTFQSCDFLH